MNTDKLLKAIQILVEAEVKKQLPIVLAEVVSTQKKKIIAEKVKVNTQSHVKKTPSLAKAILGKDIDEPVEEIHYTKNPVLNKILNETRQSTSSYPGATSDGYEEYPTMKSNIPNPSSTPDANALRAQMASKMGYGDMNTGGGLGVKTGNVALDKALNRNYSELVKRF